MGATFRIQTWQLVLQLNLMIYRYIFPLQYKATDFVVPGDGKLEISFTPKDGGEPMKYTVFEFEGTGGVALAMYNTDKVRIIVL